MRAGSFRNSTHLSVLGHLYMRERFKASVRHRHLLTLLRSGRQSD